MKESIRTHVRHAAVAAAVLLTTLLTCRPAWGQGGKQLLLAGADTAGSFVAALDRESNEAKRVVHAPPGDRFLKAMWMPDGKSVITVSLSSQPGKKRQLTVMVSDTAGNLVATHYCAGGIRDARALAGCVPHGQYLFFPAGTVRRLNLETGEVKGIVTAPGESYAVGPRGDGLCYVRCFAKNHKMTIWEVGALNPHTLKCTPLLKSKDFPDMGITPTPAFSPDLSRIAIPSDDNRSIHVFRDGDWQATLVSGDRQIVSDLKWSRDGESIFATQGSDMGTDHIWNLLEIAADGSKENRTPLFKCARWRFGSKVDITLGLSVSPDQRFAAVTTAFAKGVARDDAGLYLVDLAAAERKAVRVPFPPRATITMRGSDLLLGLARQWSDDYRKLPMSHLLDFRGGGTSAGMAALAAGKCDVSMAARKPGERDLKFAKEHGVTFETHCVAREPMVICVNKRNPIASLTIAELGSIFGNGGIGDWSEFGVKLPGNSNKLTAGFATGYRNARQNFRRKVLGRGEIDSSVKVMSQASDAITMLLHEPNAVVCLDDPALAHGEENVRIVPIRREEELPPIWPEQGAIDNGSYPLLSEFFVISRTGSRSDVVRFVRWLQSKAGRMSTDQAGYTPVN